MFFFNQWRGRMAVEMIAWSFSAQVMWPSWDSNLRPLDLWSNELPTAKWSSAVFLLADKYFGQFHISATCLKIIKPFIPEFLKCAFLNMVITCLFVSFFFFFFFFFPNRGLIQNSVQNGKQRRFWWNGSSESMLLWGWIRLWPEHFTNTPFNEYVSRRSIGPSRPRWHRRMRVRLVIRRSRVWSPPGRQHSFVEIDHEIFSTVTPFRWFKKGSCQFLLKECAQYWLTA